MSNEFSTRELIKRARMATNDRQRIFRANITFMNTNKGSENYEAHQYISVNGRNYRIFDGKDHIVPEELVEALKDAVGYKSVQTREQDLAGGVNYDDPEDSYMKIRIENYMIHIIEDVTPADLKEKIRQYKGITLTDEQEEAASRRASINVINKPVSDAEKEVSKVVYPESADEIPDLIEDVLESGDDSEFDLGSRELEID